MKKTVALFVASILALPVLAQAEKSTLRVTTSVDYVNSHQQDLEKPIVFIVDSAFAEKYNLEFYMFANGEDEICFNGPAKGAAEIIETILGAATGDAYVNPEKAVITKNQIKQVVNVEDEGGDSQFTLVVKSCR